MNNLTIKTNSTKLIRMGIVCCIALFIMCMNGFSQKAPHIVVNIADDHTIYDCSIYGSKEVSTPNIDILAKQGKKFTQAFVSSPTCTPSRSSFLTGLFPFRNGCHPNHGEVKPGTTNLRKLLYDKYYVFVVGKPGIGPGGQNLIDLGKVLSNGKVNTSVLNSASNKNKIIYKSANNKENFTSIVNSIFSAFKNQPKSICIFLAYKDPHVPWNKGSKNPGQIIVPENHINTTSYRNARRAYLKEVHYVDEMVGAVNAKVKQHVNYDNVVSIYTSDHGAQLPFAKWNMYDDGNRIPFIVRWPNGGVKAGTTTDAIISLVDLPSTFMEIGGIPANKNLDSKSFLNVLQEKKENSEECRTETYLTHTSGGISYAMRAIRTDQFKYIVNLNPRYNKNPTWYYNKKIAVDADFPYYKDWLKQTDAHSKFIIKHHERRGVQEELYDVNVDPLELNNLANDKTYDSVRLTLYYKLTKWRLQQGEQTYASISNMLPNLIAPINLVASNITKTSFKLSWSPSIGKKNPNGYKVYVSLNGSNVKTLNSSGTSVNVTGLNSGKKYEVRVSGTSSSGETGKSYPISVLVQGQGNTYEINASAGANGSITPSGKVIVNQGANQTFTIQANTGYKVKDVLVDNISVGDVTSYTFQNIKVNHTIRATFAPVPTYTISATSGLNGSISPSGNIVVNQGASQTFGITANPGYKIQDVRIDNISIGVVNSYTFTNVNEEHSIHATFEPVPSFTISATAGANGSITPYGSIIVDQGANQSFSIKAVSGHKILDVKVDNISVGAVSSYTFSNVQEDHSIHATFESSPVPDPIALYNFNGDARDAIGNNHGTINGGAGFTTGKEGQALSFDGTNDYVSISRSIQSDFSIAFWMKTSQTGPAGSYWYQGNGLVDAEMGGKKEDFGTALIGNTVAFGVGPTDVTVKASTAVNDNKWHHVAVTRNASSGEIIIYIDGVAEGSKVGAKGAKNAPSTIHFGNIHTNKRYYKGLLDMVGLYNIVLTPAEVAELANKSTITHTITASAGPNGSITPSGVITVNDGANQSFVIASNTCYSVYKILVDDVSVAPTSTYTFENIKTDHTISVTFNPGTEYTISATSTDCCTIFPSGDVVVCTGSNKRYSITPTSGCKLVDVLVDGSSVGAVTSYEFTDILGNHTIEAICEPISQHTITASASAGGSVSPSGNIPVDEGGNLTVCGTPDAGCEIQDVIVNGANVGAVSCYTFTNVMMDYSIQFNYTCDNPITVTNVVTDCNAKKKARNIISVNVSVPHNQVTSSRGKVINDGAGNYRIRETNVAFGSTNTYKITAKNGNAVVGTVNESVKAVSKCPKDAIELSPADNHKNFDFTIYPNPSSTGFNIQLDTEAYVTIYNTTGKVVYFKYINEGTTYIESSNLGGKGLYFININGKTKILEQL